MLPDTFICLLKRAIEESQEAVRAIEVATNYETRNRAKRQAKQKKIVPGFPRMSPFRNHAEAKAYLAEPELTCLVCGKPYRLLPMHLRKSHSIEPDDYRLAYGIPWTFGLVGSAISEQKSIGLKQRLADPEFASVWFANSDQYREEAHIKARNQRNQPFRKELSTKHLELAGIVVGRWQDADFLRLLELIKTHDLLLRDVAGKFEGTPPLGAATKWFYSNPERHRLLLDTIHQLSNRTQARAGMLGPRVIADIHRLHQAGKTNNEIVTATGISVMTVRKYLKRDKPT